MKTLTMGISTLFLLVLISQSSLADINFGTNNNIQDSVITDGSGTTKNINVKSNNVTEKTYIGSKVINIRSVNGDVTMTPVKDIDHEILERVNYLDLRKYDGFSEVFHDESTDSFFIKNHKSGKAKPKKIQEQSTNYKHIEVKVEWEIGEVNGDVQTEKNIYQDSNIVDNRKTVIHEGSIIHITNDNSWSVGVGFTDHDTTINKW